MFFFLKQSKNKLDRLQVSILSIDPIYLIHFAYFAVFRHVLHISVFYDILMHIDGYYIHIINTLVVFIKL